MSKSNLEFVHEYREKRIQVYLKRNLHLRLKAYAATKGVFFQILVDQAVQEFLEKYRVPVVSGIPSRKKQAS